MDLRAIGRNAVATAFNVADSILVAGTYHAISAGTYDPELGTDTRTDTETSVRALFGLFEQKENDGQNIQFGDKKILIKVTELAAQPNKDDYLVDSTGARWDLFLINAEPTGAVWILRGRAHRP